MRALDGNTLIDVPDIKDLGIRWPIAEPPAPFGAPERPGITQLFANVVNGFRHRGLDIGMVTGTSILAADDGAVEVAWLASWGSDYGRHVVLSHGTYSDALGRSYVIRTLYGHLDSSGVVVGQRVHRGQVLGHSGNTGLSSGPHLHLEVQRWDGWRVIKLDPQQFIREIDDMAIMTDDAQRDYMAILPQLKALAAVAREGGLTAAEDTPAPNDPESRAFRRFGRLLAAGQLTETEIRAMPDGAARALLLDLINLGVDG